MLGVQHQLFPAGPQGVKNQRYDTEENFGPNDMTLVWWRRLCTLARDHQVVGREVDDPAEARQPR